MNNRDRFNSGPGGAFAFMLFLCVSCTTLNDTVKTEQRDQELESFLTFAFESLGIDPTKVVSSVASGSENAVFDLEVTQDPGLPDTISLSWTERLVGDCDQNGEVNASDLAPIAAHWGEQVSYDNPELRGGLEYWPSGYPDASGGLNWRLARIDGDYNTVVNGADVTRIASHWLERLTGYSVQVSINSGNGAFDWKSIDQLGLGPKVVLRPAIDNVSPVRYTLQVVLDQPGYEYLFRVLPFDAASQQLGPASNVAIYIPSGPDTAPPIWQEQAGVRALIPFNSKLEVHFGTASDTTSPPVQYRIYFYDVSEVWEGPFEFESAQTVETTESPTIISELQNDQRYAVAVRAFDAVGNEDHNTQFLIDAPGNHDVYPPNWTGQPGIQSLYQLSSGYLVGASSAHDEELVDGVLHANGPPVYRVYYGSGVEPDLSQAEYQEFADLGAPYNHFYVEAGSQPDWFIVRVLDRSERNNEDDNERIIFRSSAELATLQLPQAPPIIPPDAVRTKLGLLRSNNQEHIRLLCEWKRGKDWWLVTWKLTKDGFGSTSIIEASTNIGIPFKGAHLTDDGTLTAFLIARSGIFDSAKLTLLSDTGPILTDLDLGPSEISLTAVSPSGTPALIHTVYTYDDGPIPEVESFRQELLYPLSGQSHVLRVQENKETPRDEYTPRSSTYIGNQMLIPLSDPELQPSRTLKLMATHSGIELVEVPSLDSVPYVATYGTLAQIDRYAQFVPSTVFYANDLLKGENTSSLLESLPVRQWNSSALDVLDSSEYAHVAVRELNVHYGQLVSPYELPILDLGNPNEYWLPLDFEPDTSILDVVLGELGIAYILCYSPSEEVTLKMLLKND